MSIDCPSAAALGRYAAGALSDAEAGAVDTHIGYCTACLDRLGHLNETTDGVLAALRKLPRAVPDAPPALARAVAAATGGVGPRPSPGLQPGTVLGGYRVVEELGRGGMGRVYRAAHPRLDQEVALKVLRPGLDSAPILARFEAERQALARMDHPHIARVFDGGATAEGQPYFAMELIRGIPITRYCDDRRLDIRRRLALFVTVCQAVQHAHQKGVIHRDLKPSNVLVTEYDGRPVAKVIDFGLAKPIDRQSAGETEVGMLVGTPESMSPEQADLTSLDIDTRTDVHALGGLLYELLTGDAPFERRRLRAAPVLEVLRIVREEEPPAPSARLASAESIATFAARRGAEPARLVKQVRGDLDWIALKALEKDRTRRYETAVALADDIDRHLNNEPVQAGPPGAGYRLTKFVRRNRAAVVATGLVFTTLVAGTVGTAIGLVRSNRERDEKQTALDEKQAALTAETQARKQAIAALVSLTDDVVERQLARRETLSRDERGFLQRIAEQFDAFAALRGDQEESRATRALGTAKLGMLRFRLGDLPAARASLEQARALYEQLGADFPSLPDYRLEAGKTSGNLWVVLEQQGRHEEAEAAIRRARDVLQPLAAEFPTSPAYRHALARCRINIKMLLERKENRFEAEAEGRQACALLRQLVDEFPNVPDYRNDLVLGHQGLGALLRSVGRLPESEKEYHAAIELGRQLAKDFPDAPAYRRLLITVHMGLGNLHRAASKLPETEVEFRRAIVVAKALVADFPAVLDYRQELTACHNNLGVVLADLRKPTLAEAEYRIALQYRKQLVDDFPDRPDFRQSLAYIHHNLGNLLRQNRKHAEAEIEHRQAVAIGKQLVADNLLMPESGITLGNFYNSLALGIMDGGRPEDSLDWSRQAIETLTPIVQRDPHLVQATQYLRHAHMGRAMTLRNLKRFPESASDWDRALELDNGSDHVVLRIGRAMCLARLDPPKAVSQVEEVMGVKGRISPVIVFNAACALSVASLGLADAGEKERVGRGAVNFLRQLRDSGYFKSAREAERLKTDTDLDPLRQRDDFKQLVADLAPKS